jgi:NAD(P)H-dependent FMN reductase
MILSASVRPGRVGPSIAEWVRERAVEHGGFEVELVDLGEVGLPLNDEPHHPRLGLYTQPHTKRWSRMVEEADAFIFVMPEYNFSFSASLKSALDYLHREWAYKPVAFVSYGGVSGGLRAVQALKQVVTTLRMMPVVEAVALPYVHKSIDADGHFHAPEAAESSIGPMLDEVLRLAGALEPLRQREQVAA